MTFTAMGTLTGAHADLPRNGQRTGSGLVRGVPQLSGAKLRSVLLPLPPPPFAAAGAAACGAPRLQVLANAHK